MVSHNMADVEEASLETLIDWADGNAPNHTTRKRARSKVFELTKDGNKRAFEATKKWADGNAPNHTTRKKARSVIEELAG